MYAFIYIGMKKRTGKLVYVFKKNTRSYCGHAQQKQQKKKQKQQDQQQDQNNKIHKNSTDKNTSKTTAD